MTTGRYTIGRISRLTGLSVRRLRFYSDEGLLPPADRTESGYRLFSDEDIIRIDLIRALRDAGLGLQAIRDVLARKLSLKMVLALRLEEVEAQLTAQQRVASALRAALASPEPGNDDLRRVWIMSNLSQAQRVNTVEKFFDAVVENSDLDPKWGQWMVRMSAPKLPDDPHTEQLDAWLELSMLMSDPDFIRRMRENGADSSGPLNFDVFGQMQKKVLARAAAAVAEGADPASELGQSIADDYLASWAVSTGSTPDRAFFARMQRKHLQHRPGMKRYWELVGMLGGLASRSEPTPDWLWVEAATNHFLERRLAD